MRTKEVIFRLIGRRLTPEWQWRADQLLNAYRQIRAYSPRKHLCPICAYSGYFEPFGWPVRPEAICPKCRSLERHRTFKLWLDTNSERVSNRRVLHFAAEENVSSILRPLASEYTTAALDDTADVVLNIEDIALPDKHFDVIFCSHVLEHVDDRKALCEMRRVLSVGGTAILLVPIIDSWRSTYEDPSIVTWADRETFFGQGDHLRIYGADFRDRVRDAGFSLDEFVPHGALVQKHGLIAGESLFVATKA